MLNIDKCGACNFPTLANIEILLKLLPNKNPRKIIISTTKFKVLSVNSHFK